MEEYYIYDPDRNDLTGWLREVDELSIIETMSGWVSPRLGIRFEVTAETLQLFRPDGVSFASYSETSQQLEAALREAKQERQRADQERLRTDRLAERLRAIGIDPGRSSKKGQRQG